MVTGSSEPPADDAVAASPLDSAPPIEEERDAVGREAVWKNWRDTAGLVRTWPPMRRLGRWWSTSWNDDDPSRPTPWWLRLIALVVAGWLGVLLALFAGFLTAYRLNGWLIPVSLVFVVAGLSAMTRFTFAVTRHVWLSVLPGVVWLIVSLVLSSRTREGDLVLVQQNWVATVYLLLGSITLGVLAYRLVVPRQPVAPRRPVAQGRSGRPRR